ncbi:zinc finger protein 678 isoform X2 [Esox lucius]|uniref:zinc finger protein 678 isoform X2 n=1 Tax=Esox lucius TaxID=8010 RepID=UPI001476C5D1|nr:zinc finger protein 678 isoform X2 [Esox lucius]
MSLLGWARGLQQVWLFTKYERLQWLFCKQNLLMVRHKQFHDEERPFPCGVCGKRFLSRSHYTEHQRVHTGERPFPCDQCERSFTTHHNLKRHQTIHAKEEAYRCRKCGVLFCQRHEYPRGIPRPDLEPRPGFESMTTMQPTPTIQVTLTPRQLEKLNKKKKKKKKKKSHDLSTKRDHSKKKKIAKHPVSMERVHSVPQNELWPVMSPRDKLLKVAYDIEVIL